MRINLPCAARSNDHHDLCLSLCATQSLRSNTIDRSRSDGPQKLPNLHATMSREENWISSLVDWQFAVESFWLRCTILTSNATLPSRSPFLLSPREALADASKISQSESRSRLRFYLLFVLGRKWKESDAKVFWILRPHRALFAAVSVFMLHERMTSKFFMFCA